MVDIKLLFFTKFMHWLILFAVFVASILLYVLYFFIADLYFQFHIFRTAISVISSPYFYLGLILIVGNSLVFNTLYSILERELRTPIY